MERLPWLRVVVMPVSLADGDGMPRASTGFSSVSNATLTCTGMQGTVRWHKGGWFQGTLSSRERDVCMRGEPSERERARVPSVSLVCPCVHVSVCVCACVFVRVCVCRPVSKVSSGRIRSSGVGVENWTAFRIPTRSYMSCGAPTKRGLRVLLHS